MTRPRNDADATLPGLHERRSGSGGSTHPPISSLYVVEEESGCWTWTALRSSDGYGKLRVDKRDWRAHRLVYTIVRGSIPEGAQLDHLCRNRACVNPDHLDPVDTRTNLMRGQTLAALNAAKTECHLGHPLSGDNLRMKNGYRLCKECGRASNRRQQARKNEWARMNRASKVTA